MKTTLTTDNAKGAIGSLLMEVRSKSGTLTTAFCDECRVKVRTIVAMVEPAERIELKTAVVAAYNALELMSERNKTSQLHVHENDGNMITSFVRDLNEDPIWKQEIEALEHSLAHYGVAGTRLSDNRVRVIAGDLSNKKLEFPIGGTPHEVLVRKLPKLVELRVTPKKAEAILRSVGRKFDSRKLVESLNAILDENVSRNIAMKKDDFVKCLEGLFTAGPSGWVLRSDMLSQYGIQES